MTIETIFALSSARGKAGVSVFRLSGPRSLDIVKAFAYSHFDPTPKLLSLVKLVDPVSKEEIDDAMVVYFKSPASFTGEDVVEIHTHGSIAVKNLLTEAILKRDDVRYANAGEFTKRAVLNGKMDLTSAEGLIDLINSETSLQQKQALNQMRGALHEETEKWRSELVTIMSLVEAFIDFPDEEIPVDVLSEAQEKVSRIQKTLSQYINDKRKGERLRSGLKLTIYGKPNVGKSSLLNFLSKREVAIVSEISGTTRDIIETHLDIGGYPIILTDTAGIHNDTVDIVEIEGIKRAKQAIEEADIKIHMQDSREFSAVDKLEADTIYTINMSDLKYVSTNSDYINISVKKRLGLEVLLDEISKKAESLAGRGEGAVIANNRQRVAVSKALEALNRFNLSGDLVLAAEDLRIASRQLAILIGKIDVEDVLGKVFSSFCIGK